MGIGGNVNYSGVTGDLPQSGGFWGSQVIGRWTRFWVTRDYILVNWISSSVSGTIAASLEYAEYPAPLGAQWIEVPCPNLGTGINDLVTYIDDANNGATLASYGGTGGGDTPSGVFASLLQGWLAYGPTGSAITNWQMKGSPLTDAP